MMRRRPSCSSQGTFESVTDSELFPAIYQKGQDEAVTKSRVMDQHALQVIPGHYRFSLSNGHRCPMRVTAKFDSA